MGKLTAMDRFDFIVIGGGMMGGPCARYLAEAGHSVALVAAPEPADWRRHRGPFGSHFDAARITRRVDADGDWALASQRSIARYRDLEARSRQAIFHEVGAVMAGLHHGARAQETERFTTLARALDDPPEVLDAAGLHGATGLAVPPGSAATYERHGGGWMAPRAMRAAQQGLAQAAGAVCFPTHATSRTGGAVALADGTQISGGHVVVATGPHAAMDGLLPERPDITVWARTIAFARLGTAEAARLAHMPSVIWTPEGWDYGLYLLPPVRYPDGHMYLKIGGEKDGPILETQADMRAWFAGDADAGVGRALLAEMARILPGLRPEATCTGPCAVTWTRTGHPYIARLSEDVSVLIGGNGAAAKSGDELGRLGSIVAMGGDLGEEGYAQGFDVVWA
ncbi:MAG: FAD-dependent oxidoreductase [Pseudomonadota bacterium]